MSQSVAKNTLYLTAASIGQKVLAFVYFLFVARVMKPENTGAYFLALSITTIFSVVADAGITQVVIREVAKKPGEAVSLVRRALWLKIPFMLLGVIAAGATARLLHYDAQVQQLVWIASVVMLADAISLLFYGVLRGQHALQFESLGLFIGQTCTAIFGGAVLVLHPTLPLLVVALLIGSLFNMLFSAYHVSRRLGSDVLRPTWDARQAQTLLRMALPFALAGIFVKVYSYVDSVFLSKFIGTAAVGVYSIAYKFTYAFQFLPMAFVAALYPGMSAVVGKDTQRLAELFNDAMWYVAILAAPISFGIWAIAPDAVNLAGEGYESAAPVLQILVFALIPIFLDFPVGSLLNAADRQLTKTAIMGVTMIINVVCNAILIPGYGTIGAAWSAVISFTFLWIAGMYFVPRVISRYRYSDLFKRVTPIVLSAFAMGLLAAYLRPMLGYVLVIPIAGIAYVVLLLLTKSVPEQHLKHAVALLRRGNGSFSEK